MKEHKGKEYLVTWTKWNDVGKLEKRQKLFGEEELFEQFVMDLLKTNNLKRLTVNTIRTSQNGD